MGRPSQQLVNRFDLTLDQHWVDWFDDECQCIEPAGTMQFKLDAASLCVKAPGQIWSGFMLPDSLPLVGNDYGDWICARVAADGHLGELIYWYHGGGDWIPVGNCLAEALLHDAIDQFRSQRSQTLRGAPETLDGSQNQVLMRLERADFRDWLVKQLGAKTRIGTSRALDILPEILGHLKQRQSKKALQLLAGHGLAEDAVACDLIELALQSPLEPLAKKEIADRLEIPWYPDYACFLFDIEAASPEMRSSILASANEVPTWPTQDWELAGGIAEGVIARRNDLAWAFTVAGWAKQRCQDTEAALAVYWAGQFASSFADQSVRLNCHGLADRSGKFSIEQLLASSDRLSSAQLEESYFQLFRRTHSRSLLSEVHDYWWNQGLERHRQSDHAGAYDCFFRSGWDLGVSRLSDYARILKALAESAKAAGWTARRRVAETHLACLQNR